jgi:hypothetical protein
MIFLVQDDFIIDNIFIICYFIICLSFTRKVRTFLVVNIERF